MRVARGLAQGFTPWFARLSIAVFPVFPGHPVSIPPSIAPVRQRAATVHAGVSSNQELLMACCHDDRVPSDLSLCGVGAHVRTSIRYGLVGAAKYGNPRTDSMTRHPQAPRSVRRCDFGRRHVAPRRQARGCTAKCAYAEELRMVLDVVSVFGAYRQGIACRNRLESEPLAMTACAAFLLSSNAGRPA
jgi:hypothetical protein